MAATDTASSGPLGQDLRAEAPRAQSLIADGAQIAAKSAGGSAAAAANSLPATTEDRLAMDHAAWYRMLETRVPGDPGQTAS